MLGLTRWLNGREKPPPAPAPAAPDRAGVVSDVVTAFPRGMDGDRHKPVATARWVSSASALETLGPWKPGRFLIGRDSAGRYVGHNDDRHILTVAGSRAGKGVSLIVPALLLWPHSCIAIDPKGELATITAARRSRVDSEWAMAMGGDVYVLDPFHRVTGPAEIYRSTFNPLAGLNPDTDDGLDLAGQIADALVVQQQGPGSHWTLSARAFLRGLVLYIAKTEPETGNLLRLRELIAQSAADFESMLDAMVAIGGVIGRAAHSLKSKPRDERGSVVSTCDVQTDFLEGESMRRVLEGSDFRLEDMKERRITVYLCLPANRLATHGRWLRLMIGLTLEAMERTGPLKEKQHPVLFCLDEFAVLDHMESIEKAAGQIAGFGVKLWPVVQDLTQLQRDYKEAWETFMGNAGLMTFFGNSDLTTLEHISKRLGETEVIRTVVNVTESWQRSTGQSAPEMFSALLGQGSASTTEGENAGGNRAATQHLMKASLMNPDEIALAFNRAEGRILAFVPDIRPGPVALNRCTYFSAADDGLFGGLFDPAPGQPLPRTSAAARRLRDGLSLV
jgi:type IV secretion system protein VirD4